MKRIELSSKAYLSVGCGTIFMLLIALISLILSTSLDWDCAPLPSPILHITNVICLINILLMAIQRHISYVRIVNILTIIASIPLMSFMVYIKILALPSMDHALHTFRYFLQTHNTDNLSFVFAVIYLTALVVALINSIIMIQMHKNKSS